MKKNLAIAKNSLVLVLALLTISCTAQINTPKMKLQKNNLKITTLIAKGKDSIISMAKKIVIDDGNDISKFTKIRLFVNYDKLKVVFTTAVSPIKYYPLNLKKNTQILTEISVTLFDENLENHLITNQYVYDRSYLGDRVTTYYTEKDILNTTKIQTFLNKEFEDENGYLFVSPNSFNGLNVHEKEDHFEMNMLDEYTVSQYKMNKETGEIYDEFHAHLIADPIPYEKAIPDEKTIYKELFFDERPINNDCLCFRNRMSNSSDFLATDISINKDGKLKMRCASITHFSMNDENGMEYETTELDHISSCTMTFKLAKNIKYIMQNTNGIIKNNEVAKKLFYQQIKNPLKYYQIKRNEQKEIYQIFEDPNKY